MSRCAAEFTKNTQLHATFDQFLTEILPLDSCKLYAIFR